MSSNATEIEANVSAAMDANPRLKATEAARQFSAPYRRLLRRRAGVPASNTREGHNKKLNSVQDTVLQDYIFMLYSCGTPTYLESVLLAANQLLYYSSNPRKSASICWTKTWLNCQSKYIKTLKYKLLSAKRLALHIVEDIKTISRRSRSVKTTRGSRTRTYNSDKTGFQHSGPCVHGC
jgi:hypothetical protein